MSLEPNTASVAAADPPAAHHARDEAVRLHGRRLFWVRALWWIVCVLAFALLVASIPLRIAQLRQVCAGAACVGPGFNLEELQALEQAGWSLDGFMAYELALNTLVVLTFFAVAVILYSRKSDDWMALYVSFAFLIFPLGTFEIVDQIAVYYPLFALPALFLDSLGGAMLGIFCYLFPDGRFVPRWTRMLAPFVVLREFIHPFLPETGVADATLVVALLTFIYAQVYRYRHSSTAVQRQQTKWFVYGLVTACAGLVAIIAFYSFVLTPHGPPTIIAEIALKTAVRLVALLIPLSLMMAILHHHLWEIDVIVNRTLVYVPLTAILAGVLAVCSNLAQTFFVAATGEQSDWGPVLGTLIVVASFDPIKRSLQGFVDRRFQATKDAEAQLRAFRAQLDGRLSAVDAAQVARRLAHEAAGAFAAGSAAVHLQLPGQDEFVHTVGDWTGDERLCADLAAGGAQYGVIKLCGRRNAAPYTPADRATLEQAAQAVAQAIADDSAGRELPRAPAAT